VKRELGSPTQRRMYDITPDGRFVALISSGEQTEVDRMNIVLNWFEELKAKGPGR
jgi:hypothetical protein